MRNLITVVALSLMVVLPVYADSHDEVANEVIALAKAQWAANIARDVDTRSSFLADDYTEFNADYPTRIDGKELRGRLAEANDQGGTRMLVGDMANAKVQVYGDVAILSYNFIGSTLNGAGEVSPRVAKSTRVYAKIDGAWKLVHANFAPVD